MTLLALNKPTTKYIR